MENDNTKTIRRDLADLDKRHATLATRVDGIAEDVHEIKGDVNAAKTTAVQNSVELAGMRGEQSGAHKRTQAVVAVCGLVLSGVIALVGWLFSANGGS